MTWFNRLSGMSGRLCLMSEGEAELLARIAAVPGDHVDIGCLWGGTAILAALAKIDARVDGLVYTIDPMTGGWWDAVDPVISKRPRPEIVTANLARFGISAQVRIIKSKSQPWPLPAELVVTSILIDGDHAFESVAADWKNASQIATRFILMHDFNSPKHPGITRAFAEVASVDEDWKLIESANTLAVFERMVKEPQYEWKEVESLDIDPVAVVNTAVVAKPVAKKPVRKARR